MITTPGPEFVKNTGQSGAKSGDHTQRHGRPITAADGQIAAICADRQATLATRNIGDFDDTGTGVVNPWTL